MSNEPVRGGIGGAERSLSQKMMEVYRNVLICDVMGWKDTGCFYRELLEMYRRTLKGEIDES